MSRPTPSSSAATRRMHAAVGCAGRCGGAALSASSYGSAEAVTCRGRALSASTHAAVQCGCTQHTARHTRTLAVAQRASVSVRRVRPSAAAGIGMWAPGGRRDGPRGHGDWNRSGIEVESRWNRPRGRCRARSRAQRDDPIPPNPPGSRVVDRCASVLAGYHPSRRPSRNDTRPPPDPYKAYPG